MISRSWNDMKGLPRWWEGLGKELEEDIEGADLNPKQELIKTTPSLESN
jgi:hypothetical protein